MSFLTSSTTRTAEIERLEAELGDVRVSLQVAMEKTMVTLSQRKQEMDRWYKLAVVQGKHLNHQLQMTSAPEKKKERTMTEEITSDESEPASDGVSRSESGAGETTSDLEEFFPRLVTGSGITVQAAYSFENATTNTSLKEESSFDESHLSSPPTSNKAARIRQQERKVRTLLSGMKEGASLDKSNLSSASTSKADRIRQQESKVRKLLSGMKEAIHPGDDPLSTKNESEHSPTMNELLGLTEFF